MEGVPQPQVLGTKTITMVINRLRPSWDDPASTDPEHLKRKSLSSIVFQSSSLRGELLPSGNIAMENGPFEDAFPILQMGIFLCYVRLPEGSFQGGKGHSEMSNQVARNNAPQGFLTSFSSDPPGGFFCHNRGLRLGPFMRTFLLRFGENVVIFASM